MNEAQTVLNELPVLTNSEEWPKAPRKWPPLSMLMVDGRMNFQPWAGMEMPEFDAKSLGLILWSDIDCVVDTDRLVKRLIGEQTLAAIAGTTGAGKTFVALDMALHIAMGWPWFGRKTTRSGVLYVAAEGQNGTRKRIAALRLHYGLDADADVPLALYPLPIDMMSDEGGVEKILAHVDVLNSLWPETPVGLVILDTLARCFGDDDENSTRDMNVFVTRCDLIKNQAKTTVAAIHHFGKDESKGMRGSIVLKSSCDTVIEIHGTSGIRTVLIEKQKDGASGETFGFKLDSVNLGTDEEGEPITSCVIEACDPVKAKRGKRPMAAENLKALGYLHDVLADHSEIIIRDKIPFGAPVVHVDKWREYLKERGLHEGGEAGKKWFQRCRNALITGDLIGMAEPYVWIVKSFQPGSSLIQ